MNVESRRDHRRVVVTGIGLVSPSGLGTEETWRSILAGRSGIAPITLFDNCAVATACTTGAHAIGDAFRLIQNGYADAMICGGTEAAVTPLGIAGFSAMRALSTRNDSPEQASRPWDQHRDGFVVGEGAGILVLEELEQATRRGAPTLAELVGYGMTSDVRASYGSLRP